MWQNVKKNWYVLVLAGVIASFFIGRLSKKPDIKIQEKVVTKEVVHEVVKQVTNSQEDRTKQQHIHSETLTTKNKDGTETTKTVIDTDTNEHKTKEIVKYVDRWKERVVTKKEVKIKTITQPKANNQLSLKLGVGVKTFKSDTQFPYFQPLYVGAEYDRKLFDVGDNSVWVGAWGMTDTRLKEINAGISLSYQF